MKIHILQYLLEILLRVVYKKKLHETTVVYVASKDL